MVNGIFLDQVHWQSFLGQFAEGRLLAEQLGYQTTHDRFDLDPFDQATRASVEQLVGVCSSSYKRAIFTSNGRQGQTFYSFHGMADVALAMVFPVGIFVRSVVQRDYAELCAATAESSGSEGWGFGLWAGSQSTAFMKGDAKTWRTYLEVEDCSRISQLDLSLAVLELLRL